MDPRGGNPLDLTCIPKCRSRHFGLGLLLKTQTYQKDDPVRYVGGERKFDRSCSVENWRSSLVPQGSPAPLGSKWQAWAYAAFFTPAG